MHSLISLSLASLLALTSAAPLSTRSPTFCPTQSHLPPSLQCSSGFIGCVDSALIPTICNGPKRFFNDCSAGSGLGSFFNCANGFKGCSTNPGICDVKIGGLQSRWTAPGTCPEGQGSWYVCANGFRGCSTDPFVCDPKTSGNGESVPKPVPVAVPGLDTCADGQGSWYVCSNGFKGCSTDPFVCDPKPSGAGEPVPVAGSWIPAPAPGTCAEGQGSWYVCSNGFKGCSTNPFICDPSVAS